MNLVGAAPASSAGSGVAPQNLGLKESVGINLVQLEVTVWPKKADSNACTGLTAGDFQLFVDGKPQQIYAVDALAAEQETYLPNVRVTSDPPAAGLSFVLFFDLWHLDVFYKAYPACPPTKWLALREARRFVREEFQDGDRLLLVTAAGWPVVHGGWSRTRAEALRSLDLLEKDRVFIMPRHEHSNHLQWIAGMKSLFLALGRYPGRKDVIYLMDDFRFDDVAMHMYEIAGRAQSTGVVVNAVDLLDSCRTIQRDGLGGTEFSTPVALNPLSLDTGGQLFRGERIDKAAHTLRTMRKCRYLVSFQRPARKTARAPSVRLELRGDRSDLTLLMPSSFQTPERAPSRQDEDEALFLLPRFGRGVAGELGFWASSPTGRHKRWNGFVLAKLERTDDEPWPEELSQITVNVLPHRLSVDYGNFRKTISGKELSDYRAKGETPLMLIPLDDIRPGDMTINLTVTTNVEELSANVTKSFTVPDPPDPGESTNWFLSDRSVRMGNKEIATPSMSEIHAAGRPLLVLGYGCQPKHGEHPAYEGRLVPAGVGAPIPVPVDWLDGPENLTAGCGWLVGKTSAPQLTGSWSFEPPPNLLGHGKPDPVEFDVAPAAAPAPPASPSASSGSPGSPPAPAPQDKPE